MRKTDLIPIDFMSCCSDLRESPALAAAVWCGRFCSIPAGQVALTSPAKS